MGTGNDGTGMGIWNSFPFLLYCWRKQQQRRAEAVWRRDVCSVAVRHAAECCLLGAEDRVPCMTDVHVQPAHGGITYVIGGVNVWSCDHHSQPAARHSKQFSDCLEMWRSLDCHEMRVIDGHGRAETCVCFGVGLIACCQYVVQSTVRYWPILCWCAVKKLLTHSRTMPLISLAYRHSNALLKWHFSGFCVFWSHAWLYV